MKFFLIGCGALVLSAASFAFRQPGERVVVERQVEVPVRVEVPVEKTVEVPHVVVEKVASTEKRHEKPASKPAEGLSGDLLAQEKMLFLFDREVSLTAEQRRQVQQVLLRRQERIEAYQEEIVRSRILRTREYEAHIHALQNESYREMAACLSPEQRERFLEVVAQGRLGDAVSFEVPLNVTVFE